MKAIALPKRDTSSWQDSTLHCSLLIASLGKRPDIPGILPPVAQEGHSPLTWPGLFELLTWVADAGICRSCTHPLSLMDDFNLSHSCPACENTESLVRRGQEIDSAGQELSSG